MSSRPTAIASAVPNRNKSSVAPRISVRLPSPSSSSLPSRANPRTTATGTPPSLPLTRSPAAASSSAIATCVTSSVLPYASVRPRGSVTAVTPATPIAVSVMPARHGRPIESLMTTPTSTPSSLADRLAQQLRRRVGVDRQQREFVAGDVGQVDAGGGEHQPVPGLDDAQRAARCDHAHGLGVDGLLPGCLAGVLVGGVEHDQAALDLRHGLGRHDEHVAVLESRSRAAAISSARSSPGRSSPIPSTGTISMRAAA